MRVIDQLLLLFARSISSKFNALNSLELSPNQRRRVSKSITDDIRTCGGLLFPEVKLPEVSEAAQQEAESRRVRICNMSWHNQSAFDKGRRVFHWEHVNPVSCIQEACEKAKSAEAVLDILNTSLRIAWILKREDQELTRLGYRSNRLDPEGAYRAAKIMLIKLQA